MSLPFFAADTLGVTLHQIKGTLKATEIRPILVGPWKIDTAVDVDSDVITGKELGFWMTFGKALRMYAIVREAESWLFVLDAEALKKAGKKTGFAGETIPARIIEFKPAIRAVFHWKGGSWQHVKGVFDTI